MTDNSFEKTVTSEAFAKKVLDLPPRDYDGKVEVTTDEDTTYWKVPNTGRTIRATSNDNGFYLAVNLNMDITEYGGQNIPSSYMFGKEYHLHFSKEGPVFSISHVGKISEQEFMQQMAVTVRPLQEQGILPASYMSDLEEVIREHKINYSRSSSKPIGQTPFVVQSYAATDGVCTALWKHKDAKAEISCQTQTGEKHTGTSDITYDQVKRLGEKLSAHISKPEKQGQSFHSGQWKKQDFNKTNASLPAGMENMPGMDNGNATKFMQEATALSTHGIILSVYHLPQGSPPIIARSIGVKAREK